MQYLEGEIKVKTFGGPGVVVEVPFLKSGEYLGDDMGQELNAWFRMFTGKRVRITVEEIEPDNEE